LTRKAMFRSGQVVLMLFGVAIGVVLVTDFRGTASRMLDRLREQPVTGRLYARMPLWVMRAFGSALARLEAAVAFPQILARFPKLATAGEPVRKDGLVLRGYESLPILVA
jgi:hypothetical protein